MWNKKLCLGLNTQFGIDGVSQIELFSRVGFDAFFSDWSRGCDIGALRAAGDRCGMEFQSIHAPFGRMDRMWKEAPDTEDTVAELCECLRDCAEYYVPIMVARAFIGFEEHSPSEIGVRNFGRVVDEAERLDRAGFDGTMTFELNTKSKPGRHENDKYDGMDIERYVTEVYIRACRVTALRKK